LSWGDGGENTAGETIVFPKSVGGPGKEPPVRLTKGGRINKGGSVREVGGVKGEESTGYVRGTHETDWLQTKSGPKKKTAKVWAGKGERV